jgi:hypothetical protein
MTAWVRAACFALPFLPAGAACDDDVVAPLPAALGLEVVAEGLTNPVYLTAPPGDARLFIVEQPGRIRVYKNGALVPTPFLDITDSVRYG